MSASPLPCCPDQTLTDRSLAPCCALGLLWLGGGVLSLLLFPALRGSVAGWGWMPLFLVLMPAAVLLVNGLLGAGSAAGEAARRVMPRRAGPRHGARARPRRRRLPQRQLVALLLGLGLHRG
jgi:hypothetical protein